VTPVADGNEADFVVVGGGSAGCVVANRLSAEPGHRVILAEAGPPDRSLYIHLPVTYYKTTGPRFTWGFRTVPQVHQGGIATPFAQARVLGGGSSINAQVYMRGTPQDYDHWRDAHGCAGWGYDDMLPYFLRSEDNESLAGPLHGQGGPLKVSNQSYTHPLTHAWLKACQQAGLPYTHDFNSPARAGCGLYQVTNRAGRRASAAVCYLDPVRRRPNLRIVTGARATRILIEDGRAAGVEIDRDGRREILRARRGVVLAAGAIGTPHLLLLSGIGPAAQLRAAGCAVIRDLPEVGRNLQDHLDVFLIYRLRGPDSYDRYRKLAPQLWAGLQYALFRSGPVTSNVVEGGAFWTIDPAEPQPDVQFHFLAGAGVEAGIPGVPGGNGCTLNAYLTRPKSRGSVRIASPDPFAPPLIDPNYLSAPEDLARTVDSVRLGRRMMAQPALAPFLAGEHFPGDASSSQADLEQFVRQQARTGYHPAGTCRMSGDGGGVVDTRLRVRGIDSLTIADNSVMPRLVSGNTNATAIAIGERAAEFVLGN
jgi:choline dehydrogenase-like flavoprotein